MADVYAKSGGVWRTATDVYGKDSTGTWRTASEVWGKDSGGTWRGGSIGGGGGGSGVTGQQEYTTAGTYSWTCPAGVTRVSVVCVGGGSGCGGALAYKNNITVVPGNSYSVVVGDGGVNTGGAGNATPAGGNSSFTCLLYTSPSPRDEL